MADFAREGSEEADADRGVTLVNGHPGGEVELWKLRRETARRRDPSAGGGGAIRTQLTN